MPGGLEKLHGLFARLPSTLIRPLLRRVLHPRVVKLPPAFPSR